MRAQQPPDQTTVALPSGRYKQGTTRSPAHPLIDRPAWNRPLWSICPHARLGRGYHSYDIGHRLHHLRYTGLPGTGLTQAKADDETGHRARDVAGVGRDRRGAGISGVAGGKHLVQSPLKMIKLSQLRHLSQALLRNALPSSEACCFGVRPQAPDSC